MSVSREQAEASAAAYLGSGHPKGYVWFYTTVITPNLQWTVSEDGRWFVRAPNQRWIEMREVQNVVPSDLVRMGGLARPPKQRR